MSKKVSKVFTLPDEEFKSIVESSKCIREVVSKLGYAPTSGSMATLVRQRIKTQNLDTSHFDPFTRNNTKTYSLDEILIKDSHYANRDRLKIRLVSEGKMEYKCAICGNTGEWNGKPLSLQLHHINGVYNDHRLENLQLLCPNCHAQTESFSGKNSGKHISAIDN